MNVKLDLGNSDIRITQVDVGKETALEWAATKFWQAEECPDIARFQLFNSRLVVPWDFFHHTVECALGRPVWTHEFADVRSLQDEMDKKISAPTMNGILDELPIGKPVVLVSL